jgi:lipid II:glycine glycyltransferase (peptidoglycan interpeptide bridge formation enzyme)
MIIRGARRAGVQALCIAPPRFGEDWKPLLAERGMDDVDVDVSPRYSTIVDLLASEELLLSRMRRKTRYNVAVAERRGVDVPQGGARDLDTFYRIYRQAGERIGFRATESREYFETLWRMLGATGRAAVPRVGR